MPLKGVSGCWLVYIHLPKPPYFPECHYNYPMVKIVTDTTACLSPESAAKFQIPIIPQVINFGEQSFLEGIDLNFEAFLQKLRTSSELPKTAAPPVEQFIKVFEKLVPEGQPVLCIHPSAEVSGTVRSALTAAAEFPGAPIHVLDTRLIATPLGILVEEAAQMAAEGKDLVSIQKAVMAKADRCRIYFLVATLDYLARGGRIGGAQALLGSVLQIKPILTFKNGRVEQYERVRTMHQALARLKEIVCSQIKPGGASQLTVLHGGNPQEAQELALDLSLSLGVQIPGIFAMPPAIVTHAGPGVLGVGFFV